MTALIRSLSAETRRRPRALVVALIVFVLLCGAGLAVGASRSAPEVEPRTITLVARDMAFFLDGDATLNPRLAVARGETIRFVLVNEDAGMPHDLVLPTLGEATTMLRRVDTTAELVVRMPKQPGEHDYVCSLHSRIMRGTVEVR